MDIIIFILYTGIESNPHLVLAGNLHGGHVVSAEEDEAHLGPFSGQRGPQAQAHQPAPGGARVLYATQGATNPPTFTLFVNRRLPPTYLRYLERMLREEFKFGSTPIKMRVRRRDA